MKFFSSLTVFLLAAIFANAQAPENLAKWSFVAKKKDAKTYEVVATAAVPKSWHIYSQSTPKGGPLPTKITFKTNPLVTMAGTPKETGALKTIHDNLFGVDVKYYSDKVEFTQPVKLKAAATTSVSGTIEYMLCNDSECTPPMKQAFDIKLQ